MKRSTLEKDEQIKELTKNLDGKRKVFKEKEDQVTEISRDLDYSRKESNAKNKVIESLREDVNVKKDEILKLSEKNKQSNYDESDQTSGGEDDESWMRERAEFSRRLTPLCCNTPGSPPTGADTSSTMALSPQDNEGSDQSDGSYGDEGDKYLDKICLI